MHEFDRGSIYGSLEGRIKYLHAFLEFGPDDVRVMCENQKYVKELIPELVDAVYYKLLRYNITARVFSTHDSRDESDPDVWLRKGDPQINNRKIFLRWYFIRLISWAGDMNYWEYLDKVGLLHIGQGKQQGVFVDYVLLGTCLGFIQGLVTEKFLSHPGLNMETKIAFLKTFNKIVWIQNDLLARYHVSEPELDANEASQNTCGQSELLGVDHPAKTPSTQRQPASSPGRCPFAADAANPSYRSETLV